MGWNVLFIIYLKKKKGARTHLRASPAPRRVQRSGGHHLGGDAAVGGHSVLQGAQCLVDGLAIYEVPV